MREVGLLLRLQGKNLLRLNELRHTKDKKQRRRLGGMLLAYVALGLVGFGYGALYTWALWVSGQGALLPGVMVALAAVLCVLTALAKAPGELFRAQQGELLFSLPLHPGSILKARLLSLYLSALLITAPLLLPAWGFYLEATGFTVIKLLRLLVIYLCAPLLPLILGSLLGLLFALVTRRLRHKTLLLALLSLLAISLFFVWVYTAPYGDLEQPGAMGSLAVSSAGGITRAWPPAGWAARAAAGEGAHLLLFVGASLLAPLLFYALLAPRYQRLLQRLAQAQRGRGRRREQAPRSPLWALTRKEVARLLSSPLYLMNTAMMAWMGPLVLLLIQLIKPELFAGLFATPAVKNLLLPFLPLVAAGLTGMSATTPVSLSMEGKSAWLMATAPVPARTILWSKALASILNAWPASLLCSGLLIALVRPPLLLGLATLLLPLCLSLLAAVLGLWFDSRLARYDWESEQQIVKNSVQTLLSVGAFFLVLLLSGGLIYLGRAYAAPVAIGWSLLLALMAILLLRLLGRRHLYITK